MPYLSELSLERLGTCHFYLQEIVKAAIKDAGPIEAPDFSVTCGERGEEAQNAAYPIFSRVRWPDGAHNVTEEDKKKGKASRAVDLAPYPLNWEALALPFGHPKRVAEEMRFHHLAGWVLRTAGHLNVPLIWGGTFKSIPDPGHFELPW